jgi:lysophospholipase L1-like esterase
MEYLLRTRHPGLKLQFRRFTTGGGTFATGLENLDAWLDDFPPTLVFFNYGGNDAAAGEAGLPRFRENMQRCVAKATARGARVVLITPQAADVRKSGEKAAARRRLYAEAMLDHGREKGWAVVDTHHPLAEMQHAVQGEDPSYTMLKDTIHLTDAAYVAWGFLLYDRLDPPAAESAATLSADGGVGATTHCAIRDVAARHGVLSFTRADEVLPILPPVPLPPRRHVPLEDRSRYLLRVTGLAEGAYEIACEGERVGIVAAEALAAGVNLNAVLLDEGRTAPWVGLAEAVWDGRCLDRIGRTRWRFEVRKRP